MAPESDKEPRVPAVLGARLAKIYEDQTEEGRAALLGFLHVSKHSPGVRARFRISRSGRAYLVMLAQPDASD